MVVWAPPPPPLSQVRQYSGGQPPFTVGALLKDTFARFGADPWRLILIGLVIGVVGFISSFASLGQIGADPFDPAVQRASGLSSLLSLLSFAASVIGSSIMFAAFDGGPGTPLGAIVRRGFQRSGWAALTLIIFLFGGGILFVIALLLGVVFILVSPIAAFLYFLVIFAVAIWVGLRLFLVLPAVTVDNLNSIDGLKLSWKVTKPSGVWARIIAAGFGLGILLLPFSIGTLALTFAGMFGGSPILLLVVAAASLILAPLGSSLNYSVYRRLVPPFLPRWTGESGIAPLPAIESAPATAPATPAPAPEAAPAPAPAPGVAPDAPTTPSPLVQWDAPAPPAPPPATAGWGQPPPAAGWTAPQEASAAWAAAGVPISPAMGAPGGSGPAAPARLADAPAFVEPVFSGGAKAILAALVAFSIAGVLAVPYVVGEFTSGRIHFPTFPGIPNSPTGPGSGIPGLGGNVAPGTVAFGTSISLSSCTLSGQTTTADGTDEVFWLAQFTRTTSFTDEIRLRIKFDGTEVLDEVESRGRFACLGTDTPEVGLDPGIYTFEVLINGTLDATGTLFVS
jgi:hypothetical protein